MKNQQTLLALLLLIVAVVLSFSGCSAHADPAAEAPPAPNIVMASEPDLFTVEHPEQFPLAAATARQSVSELVVTGTITPDIARNVPVVSLASGRVVEIHARLGDVVKKGRYCSRFAATMSQGDFQTTARPSPMKFLRARS